MIGRDTRITDVFGKTYDAHYELVDVDSLKHDPAYNRTNIPASEVHAANEEDARNYDPSLVVQMSPNAYAGTPVATAEGTVLSGNRRTAVARLLQEQGRYHFYRDYLNQNLNDYEIPRWASDARKAPFLVRVLDTPLDAGQKAEFARLSNVSPDEYERTIRQAQTDASEFSGLLSALHYGVGDDTQAAFQRPENGAAVRSFRANLGWEDADTMFQPGDGQTLSPLGIKRIQTAAVAGMLTDPELVYRLSEGV
jgi:hypothetical protein